jgi:hypothetical protein
MVLPLEARMFIEEFMFRNDGRYAVNMQQRFDGKFPDIKVYFV